MLPKYFRPEIETCHRHWLSSILGIPTNGNSGIDLLSHTNRDHSAFYSQGLAIEIKCKMRGSGRRVIIDPEQRRLYPLLYPGRDFYWAILLYKMAKPVKSVNQKESLEDLIKEREIWCLPWKWMDQFPISTPKESGPYLYVLGSKIPDPSTMTTFIYPLNKLFGIQTNKIYAPKDSYLEAYLINRKLRDAQAEDQKQEFYDPKYCANTLQDLVQQQAPIEIYKEEAIQREEEERQERKDEVCQAYEYSGRKKPKKELVERLAKEYGVSPSTVYRDLRELKEIPF